MFADAGDPLGTLRWNLAELRRLLGIKGILRGEPIQLNLPSNAQLDLERVIHGTWRQAMSVPTIGDALLEGLSFPTCPAFETWLLTERRHLANASAGVMREAAALALIKPVARAPRVTDGHEITSMNESGGMPQGQ